MSTDIRQARVAQFLKTHLVLCVLALTMTTVETISGIQPNLEAIYGSYAISIIALAMTFVGLRLYTNPSYTNAVAPVILAVDSVMILLQLLNENGLESGWAATPIFATILMPLYSDDRRLIWGLAGFQLLAYVAVFALRAAGVVDYAARPSNTDTWLYSTLGFMTVVIGATIFASRASLDVLNSQKQLRDEIDAATKALREAQDQLVQQAKMAGLGQLTAGVAHEINNPLTFVQTNLTSMERDMRDIFDLVKAFEGTLPGLRATAPESAERIEAMRDEIGFDDEMIEMLGELMDDARDGLERVQRIIADLRTFSRADTAQLRPMPLEQACAQAVQQFIKADPMEVEQHHTELAPVPIYPMLLNQVLINLLRNAKDAMSVTDGRIVMRSRADAGGAIIEVEDNGAGVSPEIRERIFEPFFTTKEVGQGTGLGLAISYQIIEHHRGRIEVDHADHGGAIFRIWLPADAPTKEA